MTVICVQEGTAWSVADWRSQLNIDKDELDQMLLAGVLRAQRGALLTVDFVGMVVFTNSCLYVSPKYCGKDDFDLTATLTILRYYFSRGDKRVPIEDEFRSPEFCDTEVLREFDAVVALRDWFVQHGFYRQELVRWSNNGRPNWTRTMARQSPLITGSSVLYPITESERRHDAFNEITALQVGLMLALSERYGLPVSDEMRTAVTSTGVSIDTWPLTPAIRQYLQKLVLAEKRIQFRSDNLRLLTLMEEILDSRLASRGQKIEIFGTTAFYSVWEDGCRVLFGGMAKPSDAIGHPSWTYIHDGASIVQHAKQLPDIVISKGKNLFILDAKYYFPFVDSKPGAPDIIKQVYYAEATASNWEKVRSLFILPMKGARSPQHLGAAAIVGSARRFPIVEAWGIEPKIVFSKYGSGAQTSMDDGHRLLSSIDTWHPP